MKTGIRPPSSDAIRAKCCECRAGYADGRSFDCKVCKCPLYPKSKTRRLKPDFSWVFSKWRRSHEEKRQSLGLTQEQYIKKFVVKSNGKCSFGNPTLFRAKCYECCNNFVDGRVDCCMFDCSLYYWMPYREQEHIPDLNWLFDVQYTNKHRNRRIIENLSREEYIARFINKTTTPRVYDKEKIRERFLKARQAIATKKIKKIKQPK
jgi:hypothetical protein